MANGMTPHYGLSQWAKDDQFVRTEFNADNEKVDAALHGLAGAVAEKAAQTELDGLTAVVGTKAAQADLAVLTKTVNTKAAQSALDSLAATVGTKAAQSALDSLTAAVNTKASQSDLNALTKTVNTKAAQTALNSLSSTVTNLTATVNTKASQSDLNALKTTVNGKGNCQILTGSYVGDGTLRALSLTFPSRPILVIVAGKDTNIAMFPGLADRGLSSPVDDQAGSQVNYSWSGSTLTWNYSRNYMPLLLNISGTTYHYMALFLNS